MFQIKVKTTIIALFVLGTSATPLFAQSESPSFKLDEKNLKYDIVAQLPNDGKLIIHFKKITDWTGKEELKRITQIAIEQYQNLQDSFKTPLSQKILSIKLPYNESLLAIQFAERKNEEQTMVFKNDGYFALKSSFDSLTVLKDQEIKGEMSKYNDSMDHGVLLYDRFNGMKNTKYNDYTDNGSQIEYSFVFKDLHNISDINISASIDNIGSQIDSVVDRYLKKWKYPNTVDKSLAIQIDSFTRVKNKSSFFKNITPDYGFGIELFNSKLANTINLGYVYVWNLGRKESGFLGLNTTSYFFPNMDFSKSASFISLNLEFGLANTTTGYLNNKSSIGIGYFFGKSGFNNNYNIPNMTRLYYSYPISKNINFELDIMTNWKISEKAKAEGKAYGVWGLAIKYMFF